MPEPVIFIVEDDPELAAMIAVLARRTAIRISKPPASRRAS
jgi:hypothetical protein